MASTTPKTMSNRLMAMKFMQRSAPKTSISEPSTPDGPPAKRVRLSNGTSAPGTPGSLSEREALSTPTEEDRKREEALGRVAAQAGETKWVLSVQEARNSASPPGLRVVHAGFAIIDADDDDSEEEQKPARMQFGGGVKKKAEDVSNSDDSDEASISSSELDSDDPTAELIRETKREAAAKDRAERKARKMETAKQAQETPRRPAMINEDMDLGGLMSLSGGRPGGLSGGRSQANIECFHCKQKGHRKADCPKLKNQAFSGRSRGGFRR